jgi:hypothetical protein
MSFLNCHNTQRQAATDAEVKVLVHFAFALQEKNQLHVSAMFTIGKTSRTQIRNGAKDLLPVLFNDASIATAQWRIRLKCTEIKQLITALLIMAD